MMEELRHSDSLDVIKEKLRFKLQEAELMVLFIEDPYRLQCVLDDHIRELDSFVKLADIMVRELEQLDGD